MYDPKHSLFFAWKEITRHWKLLSAVSRINHKKNKVPYMSFSDGIAMLKQSSRYVKHIKAKHYGGITTAPEQTPVPEFPDFLFT
jgi:thiamine biosynthesis lipoprotein ApbE